jgi:hypothetical protein
MKKSVRKNIFETNSSSTHSIVVGNNGEDVYAGLPKRLEFHGDEFGWEHRLYTDTQTKANYLFTSLIYTDTPHEYVERIKSTLAKWGIEATFEEIVEKRYSSGDVYYEIDGDYSYVDHGGQNRELVKELCEDEAKLMIYLFSDGSYVETSNDNNDYPILGEEPENVLMEYFKGN